MRISDWSSDVCSSDLAGQGWQPDEIGDAHIDRFAAYLRDIAMVSDWESVCRNTIRSWNKLVDRGAPSTIQRLTAPTPKRTPYWIASEMWPATLRSHVDELLTEQIGRASCRERVCQYV